MTGEEQAAGICCHGGFWAVGRLAALVDCGPVVHDGLFLPPGQLFLNSGRKGTFDLSENFERRFCIFNGIGMLAQFVEGQTGIE
jgi:hypothetical protein